MWAALLKRGFRPQDITVLENGQATRERVRRELALLADRTAPGGFAVFAASSHGSGRGFRAGDGGSISPREVGYFLGRVRGRVWTAMAMCFAGAFAVPGVVGPNRIATFSSDAAHLSYEMGAAGSEFFYLMVELAIIHGEAGDSVEHAFAYARAHMGGSSGSSTPVMSDEVPGKTAI